RLSILALGVCSFYLIRSPVNVLCRKLRNCLLVLIAGSEDVGEGQLLVGFQAVIDGREMFSRMRPAIKVLFHLDTHHIVTTKQTVVANLEDRIRIAILGKIFY